MRGHLKKSIKSRFSNVITKYIKAPLQLSSITHTNPKGAEVIRRVKNEKLTYLNTSALIDLYLATQAIQSRNINGAFIEAGCALGGSALVIASGKKKDREFFIFDTFKLIPPPSERDGEDGQRRWNEISLGKSKGLDGEEYYGYIGNLLDRVKKSFVRFGFSPIENNISFVPGFFDETMVINYPVALAHMDCDWYDSVMTCLNRIEPNLVRGGILIIDDYEHWSGCRKAVDEYFAGKKEEYLFKQLTRLHVIKK